MIGLDCEKYQDSRHLAPAHKPRGLYCAVPVTETRTADQL